MRLGLALPQYDYSVPGERPLSFATIVEHARVAEAAGFDSLWCSDHLFLDLGKYGGSDRRDACYEPIVTLSALARLVPRVRLGTLVLLEALRPAALLAKALATADRVSGGRIDVGLGAGWYEPEYAALGFDAMPGPGARLSRLREAVEVVTAVLEGGPVNYNGAAHSTRGAAPWPAPVQAPRPRVFVGGKGDRLLGLVARHADGWNTCWTWTIDAYRERCTVLERACEAIGRDPSTVWRTLGLYALVGENEVDLRRRYERLRANTPGVLDRVGLDEFRRGRLVGTVDDVRDQANAWSELGVETLVAGVGAVPFQVGAIDDVELLASALLR
jgi:probable F420-dependent oxidoreductase